MSHLEPLNTPRPLPASDCDIACQSPNRSRYLRVRRAKPTETFKQKTTTHAPTAFTLKAFTLNLRWTILHTFKAQRQYDFQSGTMNALFHVPHAANYQNIGSPLDHTKWLQHMDQTAQSQNPGIRTQAPMGYHLVAASNMSHKQLLFCFLLLFCFSCFSCFSAFLLFCFSAFPVSLLLCFSCFSCFSAFLLFLNPKKNLNLIKKT